VVVPDLERARRELEGRGMQLSDYFHFDASGQVPGLDPGRGNYNSFMSFQDPDGNTWLVQEVDRTRESS
jgi:hypothetical protein